MEVKIIRLFESFAKSIWHASGRSQPGRKTSLQPGKSKDGFPLIGNLQQEFSTPLALCRFYFNRKQAYPIIGLVTLLSVFSLVPAKRVIRRAERHLPVK